MTDYTTDVSLSDYVRALRRGAWIVVLTVLLATLGGIYASKRQEKLYRSSADVFLSTENLAATLSNLPQTAEDPTLRATQADLATTPQVAALAIRFAHVQGWDPEEFLSHSSVSSAATADILTFSFTDPNPQLAQRLAQAYAAAYTAFRRQLDTSSIAQALKKVDQRLSELKAGGEGRSPAYLNLLDKQQQLATLQVLQGSNAQLIRAASGAVQTQPKTFRNAVLAALGGCVLGVLLAFLREAMNTRVRTAGEVEERLDLPLLARIPDRGRRLRGRKRLVMLNEPRSGTAEAYRILANGLDFVNLERSARSIMFTSAQRGEGKSTTVANLAVALARTGRRVVLVDLDLRAPSLARAFHLEDHGGLSHVLLGKLPLEEALAPIPVVDSEQHDGRASRNGATRGLLEVLPVGPIPPNPAELAASHALSDILKDLERRADLVLVDAPPLLGLSDAVTLSARVDAVVVVTRLPAVRRGILRELRRVLQAAPVAKLGFVLTGTDAGASYRPSDYGDRAPAADPRWEKVT